MGSNKYLYRRDKASFFSADNGISRDKGKAKMYYPSFTIVEENFYLLEIFISKATNPDPLSGAFFPFNGRSDKVKYILYISDATQQQREAVLLTAEEYQLPSWEHMFKLEFDENPLNEKLYLEIIELNCADDVGTSNGGKVVGRTIIDMPERLGQIERRREPLVRIVDGTKNIGGMIEYKLRLSKVEA